MDKSRHVYEYEIASLLQQARYRLRQQAQHQHGLADLPDVFAFLKKPLVRTSLLRVQELIWTLRQLRGKLSQAPEPRGDTPLFKFGAPQESPRVYIDITASMRGRVFGGIKSVALALARAGVANGTSAAVVVSDDATYVTDGAAIGPRVEIDPGDVFVVIDHYWSAFAHYPHLIRAIRNRGARIAVCIYDLIPLDYPSLIDAQLTSDMAQYLPIALEGSDLIFTVSNASAVDIRRYLLEHELTLETGIHHFPLGVDSLNADGDVRAPIRTLFGSGEARVFLSVGSIIPHKGHSIALKAFETLWARGSADRYVILGPKLIDSPLEDAIRSHAAYGKTLFRIDDASDAEVVFAYRNATCLLQPSVAEGFGLPIIEANRHGLPIIASDIPVFREISQNSLIFFETCDATMLRRTIEDFDVKRVELETIAFCDWDASSRALRQMLVENIQR